MSSSREYLDMDNSKSSSTIKFKAKSGFFIERWAAFLLLLLFIGSIVAVGLLVYYLSPCRSSTAIEEELSGRQSLVKPDVLLPKTLEPIHYSVELQPFLPPTGNFSFAGSVHINFLCKEATKDVTLQINNVTTYESTVSVKNAQDGSNVEIEEFDYDTVKEFFILRMKMELVPNTTYNVTIKYLGLLNENMAGFYRSSYKDEQGDVKWLAVTQFQPTDARRAFPSFDEPDFKAKFDITLIRPANMSSLSNMPIARTEDRGQNLKADIYNTTVDMSTYLLAFVVSDFAHKVHNASHTQIRVWARPSAMEQVEYALMAGPKALDFFEVYFNVSFPLPKLDMIAVPDFRAGAMENWGLITFRETTLLWDKKISSTANKQQVLTVIVHELAHQWFGNLVTPKFWDGLWLNEGFATYMEYVGSNHVEPSWKMFDQFLTDEIMTVFKLDCLESSHPVYVPVNHPNEINEIFDQISYSKGASIIRMMQHFLGESTFRKGLTTYLTDLSYMNAVQDDLWHHLSMASKADGSSINVKEVMDMWTLQTGFPVVNIERDYEKQTAKLTQKRFLISSKDDSNEISDSNEPEKWHIPITYTTSVEKDFTSTAPKLWFHKSNESVTLASGEGIPSSSDWVIFNIQETAFYRANYDDRNWGLLNDQLKTNHEVIDVTGRAQILDDALDLARGRLINYSIALNLTTYLVNEIEYLPWEAATNNFEFLDRMLKYTPAYGNWQQYLLKLVNPVYTRIGFEDSTTSNHLERLNRVNLIYWACLLGNMDCVQKSTALYSQWMQNPDSDPIPPNVKRIVSCNAIRSGGELEWNFAFDRYLKSNVGAEKEMLLGALACTTKPWILGKYLGMSLNKTSGIRKADSSRVFSNVAFNPIGRFLAFDFLRDKWTEIHAMHGTGFFAISSIIKSVTVSLNTPFELKELREFESLNKADLGTATRSISQAIEETENNVMWMKHSYKHVSAWLQYQASLVWVQIFTPRSHDRCPSEARAKVKVTKD